MAEYTFILTGADCSGKSAAVKELTERLAKDFFVLVVPEAATLIIEKGINSPDPVLFQKQVLCQQLASESSVDAGANGEKDTVVFSPDNELTVTISGGTSVCHAGVIRFESGKTFFAYDSSAVGLYMGNSVTNILHVEEGAEAVLSNRFHSSSGKRLRRTGKGKLTIVPGSNDWWNYSLNSICTI